METISNVVNTVSATATKAIWGEQQANETAGNEPVSGLQGKGTATDPYDQGNSENPADPTTRNETAGVEPVSGLKGKGTATEPFDLGTSVDATNTTSLPIREKSSTTDTLDLSAKPTIPTTDAFNSATAASASTAAHTSSITDDLNTAGAAGTQNLSDTLTKTSISPQTDELNTAGAAATQNLSDTLAKTSISPEVKTDVVPAGKDEPRLAGFAENRVIDPEDESERPAEVSNATTGDSLTSSKPIGSQGASTSIGTHALSDDFAKTNPPITSPVTSPKGSSAAAGDSLAAAGATTTLPTDNKDKVKDTERVVESKSDDKAAGAGAGTAKDSSPSGEKEKVSKMEKLKEKLHIGHKH